jgi:hypothetical protein
MGDFMACPVCRVCYVNMYMKGSVLVTFLMLKKCHRDWACCPTSKSKGTLDTMATWCAGNSTAKKRTTILVSVNNFFFVNSHPFAIRYSLFAQGNFTSWKPRPRPAP